MMRFIVILAAVFLLAGLSAPARAAKGEPQYVVKVGTLAPPGTTWTAILENIRKLFEEKSKGRAKIIFYMGGVMGDEPDMIRKMKGDQLQAGAFTFQGVHNFFPELMVMELPYLFDDYGEVDYVFKKLYPDIAKVLEKKGFILLALGEEGMQSVFSKEPVRTPRDFSKQRCWVWDDEPVQIATYKALGAHDIIPTPSTEILTALQNGAVDLIYMSPLAVVGLQAYTYVNYATRMNFRYNPALYIATKSFWDSLPKDLKDLTQQAIGILKKESFGKARVGQDDALEALRSNGMTIITPTPEELAAFKTVTRPVWDNLADKVYPRWLLDAVLKAKAEYNQSKKKQSVSR